MNIPFINIKDSIESMREMVLKEWDQIYQDAAFIGGKRVVDFELALSKQLHINHVVSCANGTDALIVALQAMGIGPGKTVAIPNLTFWATYEAVVQVGATPVLIDIDPVDLQMSFDDLKYASSKTKLDAVILVHLMGWATIKLDDFRHFCNDSNIQLLEDGAQAYGVKINNQSVFAGANVSTLSFYPAKVFGGVMDGGAILLKEDAVAEKSRSLCNHGRKDHYSYEYVGWNSRMSAMQAAFLKISMETISAKIASRLEALNWYKTILSPYQGVIKLHEPPQSCVGNGYLAVIETALDGQYLVDELKKKGVNCGRVYPETMDMQQHGALALRFSDLARSKKFVKHVINLPLFSGITKEQCEYSALQLINLVENAD